MRALFVNHQQERCGVYQMGKRIGGALRDARLATYLETWDLGTAVAVTQSQRPRAIIYNWHPSTLPWATELVRRFPAVKHVGLIHEIAPDASDAGSNIFHYRMVCDPTFPSDGRSTFRSVRHVPRYDKPSKSRGPRVTVGSFGFAVGGKMLPTIAHAVSAEFTGATLRLRLPHAHYGDDRGEMSRAAARACARTVFNGVTLDVSHDFLEDEALLDWLAGNDLNVFFYEPNGGRGVASAIDYAVAARSPIAVNESQMFRHVREYLRPYPYRTLSQSLEQSGEAVQQLRSTWTPEQLVKDYASMLSSIGAL